MTQVIKVSSAKEAESYLRSWCGIKEPTKKQISTLLLFGRVPAKNDECTQGVEK